MSDLPWQSRGPWRLLVAPGWDRPGFADALAELSFQIEKNAETGDVLIQGLGEMHIEVVCGKLRNKNNVEAQLAVADVDMIGGQIEDAFSRLLDYLADGHTDQVEPVRERLLEYFMIPEATDERVKRARRRLATLMY